MRFPVSILTVFAVSGLCGAAAFAQTAAKTAPSAPKLTGFPFQDETLRYSVRWPSGLSLGDAVFSARHTSAGWNFETTVDVGVPGFAIKDAYRSSASEDLCSVELDRSYSHGPKKDRKSTRLTPVTAT